MANKTSKIQVLETKAWSTPEELERWQRGVAQWLNERRSKKTNKNPLKPTNHDNPKETTQNTKRSKTNSR